MSLFLNDDIPTAHIETTLHNGTVGDWLVLGPLAAPTLEPKVVQDKALRRQALKTTVADPEEIAQTPAERETSTVTGTEGTTLTGVWRVVNTLEDGRVDLAQRVDEPHSVCAWAYCQVVLTKRTTTQLELTTASPTHVWINGESAFSFDELPDEPTRLHFAATLDAGTNEILLRVANMGMGDLPMMVALQIPGAEGIVMLPTELEPVTRRQKLATVMDSAYLAQEVYSREQRIVLRWPNDFSMIDALTARLQTPSGRIFGEANPMIQKGAKVDFGEAIQFPDGQYEVLLQPQFEEFYVQNMRVQRRIPFQIRNGKWSIIYYGSHAERRQEALEYAARRKGDIYAEIAKSVVGKWDVLSHEVIDRTLAQIKHNESGFEAKLLALLGWCTRMGDLPDFPQEVTWALEESIPLVLEQLDVESGVVLAVCHLLAGQSFPQRSFADLHTGEWHQAHAEGWLLNWLRTTAQLGLPEGESQQGYVNALLVLSHLVDLAHSDEIAEMAAVVLDKVAYQLALQSFVGVWGGSQDEAHSEWLLNARLGPLSGVARLWWGQGTFNMECAATVALACAESYMLPEIIAAVGLDRQQDAWLRRQDVISALDSSPRVNRAAFRTSDYLLASAQGDWAAGTRGVLWQVTMGPDALIIGNRPACSSTHGAWQQNYWRGSASAVRVAQWQEVLVVAYGDGGDGLLDFSHAYFPQSVFDEVHLSDGWAMARKGNGYVALTARGGVEMVTSGPTAQRELRAQRRLQYGWCRWGAPPVMVPSPNLSNASWRSR